ncbi:hypothetical protein NW762_013495 [Fusarium torreyae]|uniref:Uncharacterized protein n=1 Tax=Fusarium torreyae TaxID=1237075 RepID=A0A9W8VAC6_9HYPO|nr:hypothetical protein NW762_013495 [Fusarium torreyae]
MLPLWKIGLIMLPFLASCAEGLQHKPEKTLSGMGHHRHHSNHLSDPHWREEDGSSFIQPHFGVDKVQTSQRSDGAGTTDERADSTTSKYPGGDILSSTRPGDRSFEVIPTTSSVVEAPSTTADLSRGPNFATFSTAQEQIDGGIKPVRTSKDLSKHNTMNPVANPSTLQDKPSTHTHTFARSGPTNLWSDRWSDTRTVPDFPTLLTGTIPSTRVSLDKTQHSTGIEGYTTHEASTGTGGTSALSSSIESQLGGNDGSGSLALTTTTVSDSVDSSVVSSAIGSNHWTNTLGSSMQGTTSSETVAASTGITEDVLSGSTSTRLDTSNGGTDGVDTLESSTLVTEQTESSHETFLTESLAPSTDASLTHVETTPTASESAPSATTSDESLHSTKLSGDQASASGSWGETSETINKPEEVQSTERPLPTTTRPEQKSDDGESPATTKKPSVTGTTLSNSVVTGSNDAVVTFAPIQDSKYTSLTKTTTTTDDNGVVVVIWPGGWKWKPSGDKIPEIPPDASKIKPNSGSDPKDDDSDDDDSSSKEPKSTDASTTTTSTAQTTGSESTQTSTTDTTLLTSSDVTSQVTSETTSECTITKMPECIKTISYVSISETYTITTMGDCTEAPSCATGEQSTTTTMMEPEGHWVGELMDVENGPSEDELNAPVDTETEEYFFESFKEEDLLLDYEDDDASPECGDVLPGPNTACFSDSWSSFCAHVTDGDNETFSENITAKKPTSDTKSKRDGLARLPGMNSKIARRASGCDGYSIEFSWEVGAADGCVQNCLGAMSRLSSSCGLSESRSRGISSNGSLVVGCGKYSYQVIEDVENSAATSTSTTEETTSTSEGTTSLSEEATSVTGEVSSTSDELTATPTIDPNYWPLVQQNADCLKPTDDDHGAIDPGTQDSYSEDFSGEEPDSGWEAGPDFEHTYTDTADSVVYEYTVTWLQDCTTDTDTQDIRWPLGLGGDTTAYSIMRDAFENCNNGGIGGTIQAGCLLYTFNGYDEEDD